jgi:hypothetical protein
MYSQTIGNQTSSYRDHDACVLVYPGFHSTPPKKYGIHVTGIPITPKIDRMNKFMHSEGYAPHLRSSSPSHLHCGKFHLHYYQWLSGRETTGEGVYTYPEDFDLEKISKSLNGIRIDKKHAPITACVVPICFNCYFPLNCEETPRHIPRSNLETPSTLHTTICEMCIPSPVHCCCCDSILTEDNGLSDFAKQTKNYVCNTCMDDTEKQERWRYNEHNKLITATSSSYTEELYLSDEAIEREKELMGGTPPKPCKDITPFLETCHIRDLIDPESRDYWPFGMNSQQYLEYKELMRFNNPCEETPDDSWREIEVTEEILSTYNQDLQNAITKFNYSIEDRGKLPAEIVSNDCKYRLVEQCHGFTCDSPVCQAVFQYYKEKDGGSFGTLVATGIPIFTTRPGNIYGKPREAGFGHERCIACVSKVIPEVLPSESLTRYTNSVKISRYTTDKKL